ncbi:Uncharacterized protein BM_BM14746 [Brugia malayi]|uniref:Bm14746 n=1 Tax=Brugia malayi TaxID=6279 RepID=A0A0J9XNX1_BRUMA|nr:Uncharacterized protein BM_BM14746 [Brugia malayi]CDP91981.1 Bm14746 [Brugia malayi]VIP00119.1 Uncharacterized protein BM_BM14746 [Brugia malayi]
MFFHNLFELSVSSNIPNDSSPTVACFTDEDTLELFYEQKMTCKRFIEYLISLQSRMPVECFFISL